MNLTQEQKEDFCKVFEGVDKLLLTEIYAASEAPLPWVTGESLAQGIRQVTDTDVIFCQDYQDVFDQLNEVLQDGDLLITMGAGPIYKVGQRWLDEGK